ncbi:hypothetical protein DICVIV_07643 [Dictyocaulus viviparus]|uniref:Uncharacterized protein n=1 Tax=Dictyocaulus viviparus TaxID=29172 RepID=A0A0D8XP54_DICVI|nr:hypothetical protein DICVIV_07643 [Dictyocaulus viviparus]
MKRMSLVANFPSPRGLLPQSSLRKLKLHSDRGDAPTGPSTPLLSALDGYTEDELSEYRQVFNMFDIARISRYFFGWLSSAAPSSVGNSSVHGVTIGSVTFL